MSNPTPPKKDDNGLELHKHAPTLVLAALPGLGAFFRDVPTRQELHTYVREHAPYIHDKELIMQSLSRMEAQNEDTRTNARTLNHSLIKLTTKMEVLTDEINKLRQDQKTPKP